MNKLLKYYFVSIILAFLLFNFLSKDIYKDNSTNSKRNISSNKFLPSDFELLKRTYPYFSYDQDAYKSALRDLNKMKSIQKSAITNSNKITKIWQFVGPTNIGGRIVDIEFNPNNPNIVYAAAATGGVFKSIDTGLTWFPIFDDQPIMSIGDIGIDPNNPDIIYVGTGEANGGHNNFPGLGIYKSIDAGVSWDYIGLDSTASISRIIVDPSNSNKIFAASAGSYFIPNSYRGVYYSEDGGETWAKSLFITDSTSAIDLVMDPSNSNILYAAMWERIRRPIKLSDTKLSGPTSGIFNTIDGGKTWTKLGIENGLPDSELEKIGRIGLTISITNPSILYAVYTDGTTISGLYKTTDGGDNWIETNNSFEGSGSFSWYFGQVRIHPINHEEVFVLDVSLLKSSNSGGIWDFSYGYNEPYHLHVDHHALAFHPNNPNYIISGNDGGINISEDGGTTWSQPAELPITQFYEIGLDRQNSERFYGGTQDNNTIRTFGEDNNSWERIFNGDGFYVLIDPHNPDIIYVESQFGNLAKSIDGGQSFNSAIDGIIPEEPTNWSTPVVFDPNNSNTLYYGTHSLYVSFDAAELWMKLSPKLTDYNSERRIGTISTIAVAPSNSSVIYVGTDDSHIWVSADNGSSWKDISETLPTRWVTRVVVNPNNENIVYVTFSGLRWGDPEPRVFKSKDMGETWQNISHGLPDAPINAFVIDNNNNDVLYLGNDIGAFVSYDDGENWEILADNLPMVVVNDMKIHPKENYLAIGTHGRGMYKIDLNEISNTDKTKNTIPEKYSISQNYPNPFNNTTTIEYTIPDNTNDVNVLLKVYDVMGREIKTLVDQQKSQDTHKIVFDASGFSSGIYYYNLIAGNFSQTKKMILLK